MAKVSNCNLYLNRTANPRMSMPDDEVPFWSLYRITKENNQRERKRMGVFTYKEMLDFIAAVKTNETFEAYPRLSKNTLGITDDNYYIYTERLYNNQRKAHKLRDEVFLHESSIQKGLRLSKLMDSIRKDVQSLKSIVDKSECAIQILRCLKEYYESDYKQLDKEINFYNNSDMPSGKVADLTWPREKSKHYIVRSLDVIFTKLEKLIEG